MRIDHDPVVRPFARMHRLATPVLIATALMASMPASAQLLDAVTRAGYVCPGNFDGATFGCTSQDITVAGTNNSADFSSCLAGEKVDVTVELDLEQNGQTRYDVLV